VQGIEVFKLCVLDGFGRIRVDGHITFETSPDDLFFEYPPFLSLSEEG
jgi:hypothetical protein